MSKMRHVLSGVFLECGSVGYHCYEQSAVPVLLLPDSDLGMPDVKDGVVVLLVNSEEERKSAVDWMQQHMSHVFDPDSPDLCPDAPDQGCVVELFIACLNCSCTCEIPQSTKDMAKELERTSTKLQPACVAMYASSSMVRASQLSNYLM